LRCEASHEALRSTATVISDRSSLATGLRSRRVVRPFYSGVVRSALEEIDSNVEVADRPGGSFVRHTVLASRHQSTD